MRYDSTPEYKKAMEEVEKRIDAKTKPLQKRIEELEKAIEELNKDNKIMSNENNSIEETLMIHCPFADEEITHDDCILHHSRTNRPFGGIRAGEWWDACQTCEYNMLERKNA